jgi:hypothetical protein
MKNIPIALRVVLNIVFYVIYVLFTWVLVWLISSNIFSYNIEAWSKEDYTLFYIIIISVFIISVIFRKYFYIKLRNENSWNANKVSKKSKSFSKKNKDLDEELEILINKEKNK